MEGHWIVCWKGDGFDRESYNIFYSKIVKAQTKDEALEKAIKLFTFSLKDKKYYHAEPITEKNYIS